MKEFLISKNDSGQRLNKFLEKAVPALPGGMMHKYLRLKRIKLNGKRTESAARLCEGDRLQLYINDEFFRAPSEDTAFHRISPDISVVYEDHNLLLADKKPGMVVHADNSGEINTLINHIKAYLYQKGEWDPQEEQSFTPALCNRIDRNTGGIVIAAKTAAALRILNDKIKRHEVVKRYLCIVHGRPVPPNGTIDKPLWKDSKQHQVFPVSSLSKGAKRAVTHYRTLEAGQRFSLLECTLETGRTHQIRAHMASIGHPLLGDGKYGGVFNRGLESKYQFLYSYQITFAFRTPAEDLSYLNGQTFTVKTVKFAQDFHTLDQKN